MRVLFFYYWVINADWCFFSCVMKSWIGKREFPNAPPRWIAQYFFIFIDKVAPVFSRNEHSEKTRHVNMTESLGGRVSWKENEGPAIGRQTGMQAGYEERSKQAGQIRESRKRGRLQFVLWSSAAKRDSRLTRRGVRSFHAGKKMTSIARHSADEHLFVRKKCAPYCVHVRCTFSKNIIFKYHEEMLEISVSRLLHFIIFLYSLFLFCFSLKKNFF